MTDAQAWNQFNQIQKGYEAKYTERFYALIRRQARRVAKYLRENGIDNTMLMINLLIPEGETATELKRLYREVGLRWGNLEQRNIESYTKSWSTPVRLKAFGFNEVWEALLNIFFNTFGGKKIVSIDDTTREWLIRKIEEGRAEGLGAEQIARSMVNDKEIPLRRARVIARTETVGAANFGGVTAARQTGLQMIKRWVNAHDSRVREAHKDKSQGGVGGEEVGLEERFSNGLRFPGDPEGEAKQVVQCRCLASHRPARDERGMPIRI